MQNLGGKQSVLWGIGKQRIQPFFSASPRGALQDDTKNGCVADQ